MIKNTLNIAQNYKFNISEKSPSGEDKLMSDQLAEICNKPVKEIIPELYGELMADIAYYEKGILKLIKKIEKLKDDLSNRVERLELAESGSVEYLSLIQTKKELQYEIIRQEKDLYDAEIEFYNLTISKLSTALGVGQYQRSEKTLERQKRELKEKYPNFDIQYISIVTAWILVYFERKDNLPLTGICILIAYLCINSIIDSKKIIHKTEESINHGYQLLETNNCDEKIEVDKINCIEVICGHYSDLLKKAIIQFEYQKATYLWDETRDNSRNVDSTKAEVDKIQTHLDYCTQILDYLKSQK